MRKDQPALLLDVDREKVAISFIVHPEQEGRSRNPGADANFKHSPACDRSQERQILFHVLLRDDDKLIPDLLRSFQSSSFRGRFVLGVNTASLSRGQRARAGLRELKRRDVG